jgi:hypothetical protein
MSLRLALSLLALAALSLSLPGAAAAFDFSPGAEGFEASVLAEGGQPSTQAGSHPLAASFAFNFVQEGGGPFSEGDLRSLSLVMPPGLIENPTAIATKECSQLAFETPRKSPWEESLAGESCPDNSQVGTISVRSSFGGGQERTFGLFNLSAPPGAPSELGASPFGDPIVFVPSIRQAQGEYGITLEAKNVSQLLSISGLTVTIWGIPWSVIHNEQRGDCLKETEPSFGWGKCSVGRPSKVGSQPHAYLTLPTSCEEPLDFTATAEAWPRPGEAPTPPVSRTSLATGVLGGCQALPFEPHATALLSDPRASSPSGYSFDIEVDTSGVVEPNCKPIEDETGCAPTPVRRAVVTLPQGVTINPSVGAGLGVCSLAQYEVGETPSSAFGTGCPTDSKIGDFSVKSPIVTGPIEGNIYLAAPHENPFGSLIAVYLVAKSPARGILVKVAGELRPDPTTGSLTATFEDLPQLPYSDLHLHFREGQRSPLATPAACGPISTEADFTPWRDPSLVKHASLPATIAAGFGGGPCPSGLAPFAPQAKGGTLNSRAGAYSPFYLHLTRNVTEQEITSYSATFPPGLLGKIAGIPYCPDADIEAARHSSGVAERDRPSCPAASLIGHTYSGYGVGSVLAYAPGNLYLAGPYRGSAFSVVAIDSALVGPFDLGTVIVRSAVRIDPETTQASIDATGTDPIPHIIDGVPIHLRDIRAYLDRPGFTLNPTSCEPFKVASALNGAGQRFGDPSDDTLATATSPFQAFDCASLGFRPRIGLSLKGGHRRGAYPSLRVVVRPRAGDANIASSQVTLPRSIFLDQSRIRTICTRAQFAAKACPAGSVYGHVRAFTPLLEAPMEGPAILRSSSHTLPDLVFVLRGHGVEVDVAGRIDSHKGGIRGSFPTIPDAPVSKFVLKMNGGKRGVLVDAEDLCRAPQRASARFVGHANRGWHLQPEVKPTCKKKHGKRGKGR